MQVAPPPYLYKFRKFSTHLISELCNSQTYFASPGNLNDPLDSKPSFRKDLGRLELETLLSNLLEESASGDRAASVLQTCRYNAGEEETDEDVIYSNYMSLVGNRAIDLVQEWLGFHGILSLGSKWDCPLMWSHYGDQHTGVCLEYSTENHVLRNLMQVRYDVPRSISLKDVYEWKVLKSQSARRRVIETAFLAKAPAWSYEQEWRSIAKKPGVRSISFDLTAIHFGERCDQSVKTAIVKMMYDARPAIELYDVAFCKDSFDLRRHKVDVQEILQVGLRQSAELVFKRVPLPSEWAQDPLDLGIEREDPWI